MVKNNGISVIIPNYNGRYLLAEVIPPLHTALQQTGLPYEIIISDDKSADDSVTYIRSAFPEIKVLESDKNSGFSPAINKGIFIAEYDLLLLLNSDVKLSQNYFEKILPYFDIADTFGVMGRIVGWDDDEIQDGGKYPAYQGAKIKTSGNYYPVDPAESRKLYSMYLSGANALVSREKITELGGFDELFAPFYVEDFELSLRAWRIGWKCYYEHNAICRHKTSATIKTQSSRNFIKKIYYRNKMFLHALHPEVSALWLWYVQLIPEMIMHLFLGRFWFFSSVKMYIDSKKKIQASRERFSALSLHKNVLLSVNEVVNKILLSLKGIPIKRF